MRRGREDQLSETGSRPAYLDEFERKLAASLDRQTDTTKTRLGSEPSSDVNVEVPSSPSLGEALTPRSVGGKQALDVGPLRPSSETREKRTHFSSAEPTRVSPQGDNAHDAAKAPAAGRTAYVHATQPMARRADLAETSSGRAIKSRTEPSESFAKHEPPPAVAHSLPRGNVNGPTQEIGAALGPAIDVEALLANVEASLANDAEVGQVVKPVNLHARAVAEVIKRFSRDWKLMASACAFVSVAMVGVVTLSHGRAPQADEPSLRETMRDNSAEQTRKDRAPEPSSAAEDRLGANSDGVGGTASAPQANETPGSGATQATVGLTNGAASGSTTERSDPTGSTSPLAPPAQPSGNELAPADRTATAASPLGPAQSLDLQPAPTVSPQPAPTPTTGTFPTEGSLADHAPQPTPKPKRNLHDVGTAKLSAPRPDVAGKPSIGAKITKNDATSTPAVAEKSNQSLPDETPTKLEKKALASNAVQSPPADDPGASAQPFDHPTNAVGRGVVLSGHADPDGSNLRHAIGGLFGAGTAPGD
jgi:hypothetical protein